MDKVLDYLLVTSYYVVMPLVNTWIKNEDWDKYYQLASTKQWGEFIHNALSGNALDQYLEAGGDPEYIISSKKDLESQFGTKKRLEVDRATAESHRPIIKTPEDTFTAALKERFERVATNGVCKVHGTPLTEQGKCLQKGCKYS